MSDIFDLEATYEKLKQFHEEKELSPYEANIFDFVSVIKEKPNLLTAEDKLSLEKLLTTLPDNVVEVSNQIAEWYEERPHIEDAIFELPIYTNQKGAGSRKVKPTDKEIKELIEHIVHQSSNNQSSTTQS